MLAHVNNVQPKAELPLVRTQKHSNAMPQRTPKTTQRNLTGLYLGVEGGNQRPQRQNTLPMKSRGRGMPSRRIRTPTEERRYKKVEMLRSGGDRRGFSGNPVKHFQARGLASTDEMARASMYPADSDQFWDVTRQTTRQFTAPPNSGIKHLEYLNPDPDDIISTYYPRAFDKSLDEVLVQEIQKAVNLKKEVAGLVYCYNKICKGNTRALQSLLPSRGLNPSRTGVCLKTGFSIKSYQSPRQAEIVADFPKVQPRPKTVVGFLNDRPLVPSPYFFKLYNAPKTAGHRTPLTEADHQIVAAPGVGCLSRTVNKGKPQPQPGVEPQPENRPVVKTTTLNVEELIPGAPSGAPVQHTTKTPDDSTAVAEKVNVTLPVAGKASPVVDQQSTDNEAAKDPGNKDINDVPPAINMSTEEKTDANVKETEEPSTKEINDMEHKGDDKEADQTAMIDKHDEALDQPVTKNDQEAEDIRPHKDDDDAETSKMPDPDTDDAENNGVKNVAGEDTKVDIKDHKEEEVNTEAAENAES